MHYRWRRRRPGGGVLRHLAGRMAIEQTVGSTLPSDSVDPATGTLEQREAFDALAAAIETLPHDLKVPLLLHQYERLSYDEIGKIIRCSPRGVETRLYRARQYLPQAELTPFLRAEGRA